MAMPRLNCDMQRKLCMFEKPTLTYTENDLSHDPSNRCWKIYHSYYMMNMNFFSKFYVSYVTLKSTSQTNHLGLVMYASEYEYLRIIWGHRCS